MGFEQWTHAQRLKGCRPFWVSPFLLNGLADTFQPAPLPSETSLTIANNGRIVKKKVRSGLKKRDR